MTDAVVFDLDGVLVDSEGVWDGVREELAGERGGTYPCAYNAANEVAVGAFLDGQWCVRSPLYVCPQLSRGGEDSQLTFCTRQHAVESDLLANFPDPLA